MRLWLTRIGLLVVVLLLPEWMARTLLPGRGLTFTESIARAEKLDVPKAPQERRIFIVGASSMMGYHHFGQSSLSQALAFILNNSAPDHPWKVVTFAMSGEGSPFVFQTARESLRYQPDLLLLYVGENEFGPIPVLRRQWRYRLEAWLLRSKLLRVSREVAGRSPWPTAPDFTTVGWNEVYERVQLNRERILADFVLQGTSFLKERPADIAVVFLRPILAPRAGPALWNQLEKWQLDWSRQETRDFAKGVIAAADGNHEAAIEHLQKAEAGHPDFALTPQYLSISLGALGRRREAEAARQRALNLDVSPAQLPIDSYEKALQGASSAKMILLEAQLSSRRGTARVPAELIEDGCHPTVQLEFEEAREILEDPLVRQSLGYANDPSRIPFERYAGAQQLNKPFFAKVYLQIGRYLIRDASAESALHKALSFAPENPEILNALRLYEERRAAQDSLLRRVLAEWKSHV